MKTIKEADLKGKTVIVRVDYNVPIKNGIIEDENRIKESLDTIKYLLENNCKIILMSHLAKVKTIEDKDNNSLDVVSKKLGELLNMDIHFSRSTRGEELESKINLLNFGEILLMENTRFEDIPNELESKCDDELSKYWASLGEIFILDAFGSCHRNHASTYGIGKYLPTYIGFLVEKELNILKEVMESQDKIVILGGAKVEDKLTVVQNLINSSSKMLIGGVMAFTFLKASGVEVGPNFVDLEKLDEIRELYNRYKEKIILPLDFLTNSGVKNINELDELAYDVGPLTIEIFKKELTLGNLVVWNGTLGKFEEATFEAGTKEILEYLNESNKKVVIAGGDTGNAAHKYNLDFYYVSTGGGATLEYLSGNKFKTLENAE